MEGCDPRQKSAAWDFLFLSSDCRKGAHWNQGTNVPQPLSRHRFSPKNDPQEANSDGT